MTDAGPDLQSAAEEGVEPAKWVFVAYRIAPGGDRELAAISVSLNDDSEDVVLVQASGAEVAEARDELRRCCAGRTAVVFDRAVREALALDRVGPTEDPSVAASRFSGPVGIAVAELSLFLHLVVPEPGDSSRSGWSDRYPSDPVVDGLSDARELRAMFRGARHDLEREGKTAIEALRRGLESAGAPEAVLLNGLTLAPPSELSAVSDGLGPERAAAYETPHRVEDGEIVAAFAEDGPMAKAATDYRRREEQVSYSRAVSSAIARGDVLMVEAGTGVGKSFGYLLPLLLHAHRTQRPVVVATRTKNLQAQLYHRDVPALIAAMDLPVRVALVKGRGDYLCRKRLADRLEAAEQDGDEDERLAVAWFDRFARRSADGDLERVPPWILDRVPAVARVLAGVRCEHGASGRRCSFGRKCFYPQVSQRAKTSHLLIANHALVLRWPRAYPLADVLVLDEAHDLIDGATSAFAKGVGEGALRGALRRVVGQRSSGGLLAFVRRAARVGEHLPMGVREQVEDCVEDALRLAAWLPHLSTQVCAYALSNPEASGFEDSEVRRDVLSLDLTVRESRGFADLVDVLTRFGSALRGLRKRLLEVTARLTAEMDDPEDLAMVAHHGVVRDRMDREEQAVVKGSAPLDDRPSDRQLRLEVAAVAYSLQAAGDTLDEVIRGDDGAIAWIEVVRSSNYRRSWFFRLATLDVGASLHGRVLEAHRSVVLTSATLRVRERFEFHSGHLGVDYVDADRRPPPISFGSPYDYTSALRFFVPIGDDEARLSADSDVASLSIARIVLFASLSLGGRTLALFQSRARMIKTAKRVRPSLERLGITVLCSGPDGPPARVLERFREAPRALLLGSRAFFEGIDVPGSKIRCALIDRIPFETPDEPVHRARTHALDAVGRSGFREYSLPRAILRLRQAAGRVVRGENDRGSVILLDPRAATRGGYGAEIREALPSGCHLGPEMDVMGEWLNRHASDLVPGLVGAEIAEGVSGPDAISNQPMPSSGTPTVPNVSDLFERIDHELQA